MQIADRLPPPPRQPRLRAGLRHRFVLGVVGVTLVACAIPLWIALWVMGVDLLPFEDAALDEGAVRSSGTVTAVETTGFQAVGLRYQRVAYRFVPASTDAALVGSMLVPRGTFVVGDSVGVEYLPDDPAVNRVSGHRRNPADVGLNIALAATLLPGIALVLVWLRGVMRLRLLLTEGHATRAAIVEQRATPFVSPPQLAVVYEFEDRRGQRWQARHQVFRGSTLGRAIGQGATEVPVVYDEGDPGAHSRLAVAADFT